jgi:GH18 family chitinase
MRVKAAYANQQALGGMMFWEASEDTTTAGASLSDAVYEGMRLP